MNILPPERFSQRDLPGLRAFLDYCRNDARDQGVPRLASISLEVDHIDPLAVLQSIYDPAASHFFAERTTTGEAIAAAESVLTETFSGPERFTQARAYHRELLDNTIAIGDLDAPHAGPHLFFGFSYHDQPEADTPFHPATVFVPRWQVAQSGDRFGAVANAVITPDADTDFLAEKIWAAQEKFFAFDYTEGRAEPPVEADFAGDSTARETYRAQVRKALEAITEMHFNKVVLARPIDATMGEAFRPFAALYRLREKFPNCTVFSFSNERDACFFGATPERLVEMRDGKVHSEAIAGTRPRGETPARDAALGQELLRSDKDLREHRAVIRVIEEALRRGGLQARSRPQPGLLKLQNVQHLITPIQASGGGKAFLDLVGRLHPTPAIGGDPAQAASEFLRTIEPFARGLFAGALGWVDAQDAGAAFVGIRSGLAQGKDLRLIAGAGIVEGSVPEAEDAEVTAKLRAMREIFEQKEGPA